MYLSKAPTSASSHGLRALCALGRALLTANLVFKDAICTASASSSPVERKGSMVGPGFLRLFGVSTSELLRLRVDCVGSSCVEFTTAAAEGLGRGLATGASSWVWKKFSSSLSLSVSSSFCKAGSRRFWLLDGCREVPGSRNLVCVAGWESVMSSTIRTPSG